MHGLRFNQTTAATFVISLLLTLFTPSGRAADQPITITTHTLTGTNLGFGSGRLVFAGLGSSTSPDDAEISLVAVRTGSGWLGEHWELRLAVANREIVLASDKTGSQLIQADQTYKAVLSWNRETEEVSAGFWNLNTGRELATGFWYVEAPISGKHPISGAVGDTDGAVLQTESLETTTTFQRMGLPLALRNIEAGITLPDEPFTHAVLDWNESASHFEIKNIEGRLPGTLILDIIVPDSGSRQYLLKPEPRISLPLPADQGPPGRYTAKISYSEPGYTQKVFETSWNVNAPEVHLDFKIPEAFALLSGTAEGPIEGRLVVTASHALSDVALVATNMDGQRLLSHTGVSLPAGVSEWPFIVPVNDANVGPTLAAASRLLTVRAEVSSNGQLPENLHIVKEWYPIMSDYVFSHDRTKKAGSTDGFVDVNVSLADVSGYPALLSKTGYTDIMIVFTSPSGNEYRRRAIRNEATDKWTTRIWTDESGTWNYSVELGIGTAYSRFDEESFVIEEANYVEAAPKQVAEITYIPFSSVKVNQLIGDFDPHLQTPTLSRTLTRYAVKGTDLGNSFTVDDHIIFLFGDGIGPNYEFLPSLIASAPNQDPETFSGLQLNFYTNAAGKALMLQPPGLAMGPYEVPTGGIKVGDHLYLAVKKDRTKTNDGRIKLGSALVEFNEDAGTFRTIRELSPVGGKFDEVNMHLATAEIPGLPNDEPYVLIWGTGEVYRNSPVYLAAVKVSEIELPDKMHYFAGLDNNGRPLWGKTEADAKPLEHKYDNVGEFGVAWSEALQVWLMTYNGVGFQWAKDPWGPWSKSQNIFGVASHGSVGTWVQNPSEPVAILSGPTIGDANPSTAHGAAYGCYMVEAFTRLSGDILTLYWLSSTWNPYTVVLMRSDLKVVWAQ